MELSKSLDKLDTTDAFNNGIVTRIICEFTADGAFWTYLENEALAIDSQILFRIGAGQVLVGSRT